MLLVVVLVVRHVLRDGGGSSVHIDTLGVAVLVLRGLGARAAAVVALILGQRQRGLVIRAPGSSEEVGEVALAVVLGEVFAPATAAIARGLARIHVSIMPDRRAKTMFNPTGKSGLCRRGSSTRGRARTCRVRGPSR